MGPLARSLSLAAVKQDLSVLPLLLLLPFAVGCGEAPSDGPVGAAVRIDACQPALIVLDPGVTPSQELGVRTAVDLWNHGAGTRVAVATADDAAAREVGQPPLPLHFRPAAAPSHGFFNPNTGEVLINDD